MRIGKRLLSIVAASAPLLAAIAVLGDSPATQPADKPPLVSKAMKIGDECTVLLSGKLQDYLQLDAVQLMQMSDLKDQMEFQIENAPYIELAGDILARVGQQVRDLLTLDQDQKLQELFDEGTLKPLVVRRASAADGGGHASRGVEVCRSFEILYSKYGVAETAVAAPPPESPTEPTVDGGTPGVWFNHDVPAGCVQSEIVGGPGGGPFVSARTAQDQVIGFHYSVADWMNHQIIHQLDPIYPTVDGNLPSGTDVIVANGGYAVGGLVVDADDCVNAFQVIFVRVSDGKIEAKDTYTSQWYGIPTGHYQRTLGNNGQAVIGIFGRRGLNLDAVGIVQSTANP
jgi:hypothetical protein